MAEYPEQFISATEDGPILVCIRQKCRVVKPGVDISVYWTERLRGPYLTPEQIVAARDAHLDTHAAPEPATRDPEKTCWCGAPRNTAEEDPDRGCSATLWHDPNAGGLHGSAD